MKGSYVEPKLPPNTYPKTGPPPVDREIEKNESTRGKFPVDRRRCAGWLRKKLLSQLGERLVGRRAGQCIDSADVAVTQTVCVG